MISRTRSLAVAALVVVGLGLALCIPSPAHAAPGHTWSYDGFGQVTVWIPPSEIATSTVVTIYRDAKPGTDFATAQYSSSFNNTSPTYTLDYQLTTKSFSIPVGTTDGFREGYNLIIFRQGGNVVEKHSIYIPPDRSIPVSIDETLPVSIGATLPVSWADGAAVSLDSSVSIDSTLPVHLESVAGLDPDGFQVFLLIGLLTSAGVFAAVMFRG